jgi:predicted nucleotidyltransferase
MAASINYKLDQLSREYYISYGSTEQKKIDASVVTLKTRLRSYFGNNITNVVEFGSYKRDTILPRKFDEHSDVDLMVVFNRANLKLAPGTYRTHLIAFAEKWYSRSEVYRSNPTVVLDLDHIKYDLVPSYEETNYWSTNKTTYIPQNDSSWMTTDPHGFNIELTRVNTANHSNIKKVIRLLKAWNAKVGYPIESFSLEKEIAGMQFWFLDTSLEAYFFDVIQKLNQYRNGNVFTPNQKIMSLKENANRIKAYLKADNIANATAWLAHILPI